MRTTIRSLLAPIAAFALCLPLAAQDHCSELTVHGDGRPDMALVFGLHGAAPHAPALLAIAAHEGHTTIDFGPFGTLRLGLMSPLHFAFMGTTDGHGNVRLSVHLGDRQHDRVHLFAQGFTVVLGSVHGRPRFEFCTSNVVRFGIGNHD